jgi:Leucine-rich repeat (LRR) protein
MLQNLEELDLSNSQITDAGLAHLKTLTKLEDLDLSATNVTDAGLAYLEGLSALKYVYLRGTKVTAAGVDNLQRPEPYRIIIRSPPPQPIEGGDWDQEPADSDEAADAAGEQAEKADVEG